MYWFSVIVSQTKWAAIFSWVYLCYSSISNRRKIFAGNVTAKNKLVNEIWLYIYLYCLNQICAHIIILLLVSYMKKYYFSASLFNSVSLLNSKHLLNLTGFSKKKFFFCTLQNSKLLKKKGESGNKNCILIRSAAKVI